MVPEQCPVSDESGYLGPFSNLGLRGIPDRARGRAAAVTEMRDDRIAFFCVSP